MLENKYFKRFVLYCVLMPAALLVDCVDMFIIRPLIRAWGYVDEKFTELGEWAQD